MKLLRYVLDAGGEVRIPAVDAPQTNFNTADEAVQLALNWELEVTRQINSLMEIALSENDYLARHFLDWFVEEQLEEVNKMEKLLKVVRSAGERNLYMMEAYITHLE
jgi:bacterioferritin B